MIYMTAFKKTLLISLFICFNHLLFGQIKLTSPQSRAVYQRDVSGFSNITIAGTYQQQVDRVEARLTPVQAGQGEATNWKTIKTLPLNGNFSATINVKQGWYILEVRGSLNGTIIGDVVRVDRVGIGEVFIIAGQSNAEGVGFPNIGANDDRVNCYSTINSSEFGGTYNISLSPFSKLDANTNIAPRGIKAWCWGRLGDLIASRLNVPVMFFNVGLNGTSSSAWATTASGNYAPNPYIGGVYQNKLPYQNLSDVLKYYVPQLGVRAVLWCQGEADNEILNNKQNVSSGTYKANLQTVINRTRTESGKDISWMVSLTSASTFCPGCVFSPFAPSDNKILDGQRATINETSNVFKGPETDGIQNPGRQDGVHFSSGLSQLADAWFNAIDDSFLQKSKPQLPTTIPDIAFNCGDNQVEVSLPDGYSNYEWSVNNQYFDLGKFSSQRKINLNVDGGKQYYARMRDVLGNVTQVPAISFKGSNIPLAMITATGATDFCEGNKATLKANDGKIFEWNTGSKSQEISVTTSGSYAVKIINDFGCQSNFSTPINVVSKPVPPTPTITANSPTFFCADTNVTLQSSNQGATSYLWNNGTNSKTLKINTTGSFTVKTISDKGCISLESNAVKVVVNPLPATPSIVPNGPTTFCADTSVTLSSSNQDALAYRWSTGSTTRNITIRNSGDYTVKTIDRNGCISNVSFATKIKVNALPPIPSISSTRDTVFCQGENTIIQMSLVNGGFPSWLAFQDGVLSKYNFQNLNVNKSGSFQGFQTDLNGCKSGLSRTMFISVKPIPAKIENIARLSPYTIGIENPKSSVYIWQFNDVNRNDYVGSIIRFNETGRFRVTAKNTYKTQFYGDKVCLSEPSNEFIFELYDDKGFSIYPNPSNGVFNLDSKIDWRNSTVDIYDLGGVFVRQASVSIFDNVKTIDLTALPDGEYMLRIRADNFYTITKRLIINR
jgi:Secretion system C-terminal sorting domain/Carbohydrate esterase, sialic acid-specific acetylesterase